VAGDPPAPSEPVAGESARERGPGLRDRLRGYGGKALVAVVVLACVALGMIIGAAVVPRWWSHRVGDQVDGSLTSGTLIGLSYGFLFTLLPLLVLGAAALWARSWRLWAVAAGLATLLALPNLMTLGIVLGVGNAAHAADRTLDVEAPAFRGASLAGAVGALFIAAVVVYLVLSRWRDRGALMASRRSAEDAKAPDAQS
jgi:hypothetical protein